MLSPNSPPFWLITVQRRQPVSHTGRGTLSTQDVASMLDSHTYTKHMHIRSPKRLILAWRPEEKQTGCDIAGEDHGK